MRLRLQRGLDITVPTLCFAHLLIVPWWFYKEIWPFTLDLYLLLLVIISSALGLIGIAIPITRLEAARCLDRNGNLDQRIEAAVEFINEKKRPIVAALIRDAAERLSASAVDKLVPIRVPKTLFVLGAAILATLGLWWWPQTTALLLPPAPNTVTTNLSSSPAEAPLAKKRIYDTELPPPSNENNAELHFSEELALHRTTEHTNSTDFAELLKTADTRLLRLEGALVLPTLQIQSNRSAKRATLSPSSRTKNELALRSSMAAEITERLEELETLWGSGTPREGESTETEDQFDGVPSQGTPAEQPQGNQASQENPSDSAGSADIDNSEPQEESNAPQSDRYSSAPETTNSRSTDLPPFPRHGDGEGFDDQHEDSTEGAGRTSGQPGTGEAELVRGPPNRRINNDSPTELSLVGTQQTGHHDAYEADSRGLNASSKSQYALRTLRIKFIRRAEEELGDSWVPFASRAHVKRYFQALETWVPKGETELSSDSGSRP